MLLVSACLAGPLGCATGTWPSAVADRTLTLPKGEHRLFAHAGVGKDIAGLRSDIEPVGGGSYAYGVTDRLQFNLPLIMAYRLGGARHELLVSGGVTGAGYRSARPLEALDDPRLRRPTASSFLLGVGAQVATRVHLAPGRALDASLVAGTTTDFAGFESQRLRFDAGVWQTAAPWLSVGLFFGAGQRQDERARFDPFVDGQLRLWWHLSRQVDVAVVPTIEYRREGVEEGVNARATLGVDWHFD